MAFLIMNDISETRLHPYLLLFNRHVVQLQKHLSGLSSSSPSTDSLIGGVLWTAEEKNKFFHALSVYSRLRPDLIAACIRTKNEAEVLEYLLLLEDGSRTTGSSEACVRASLYSARQVSDSWITWEEANAERLRLNEAIWDGGPRIDGEDSPPRDDGESSHPELQPLGGLKDLTYAHLRVLGKVLQPDKNYEPDADMVTSSPIENAHPMASGIDLISPAQIPNRSSIETLNNANNGSNSYQELQADPELSEENTPAPPQDLSPRSRRRYQKRIHMRRKRAQLKREETDLTTYKLKTGPRKNTEEEESPEASPSMITRSLQIEIGAKNLENTKTISKDFNDQNFTTDPGEDGSNNPSLDPIHLRSRLVTAPLDPPLHNISLDAISATGLDIFNYPKMGKLLEHFFTGYDSDMVDQNASISTETCILLLEILKDFLVQLISRVITLEEEHQRLRGTTKVWRKNTDDTEKGAIDSSAIQFALKSMGIFEENLSQFFTGLLGEDFHQVTYNQTGYEDNERLVNRPNVLSQHPLHQDVCLPHYHSNLFPEYCNPDHPDESTNNLQEEADDESLLNEMQEEGELEREDEMADQRHEITLWREVRKRKR